LVLLKTLKNVAVVTASKTKNLIYLEICEKLSFKDFLSTRYNIVV